MLAGTPGGRPPGREGGDGSSWRGGAHQTRNSSYEMVAEPSASSSDTSSAASASATSRPSEAQLPQRRRGGVVGRRDRRPRGRRAAAAEA